MLRTVSQIIVAGSVGFTKVPKTMVLSLLVLHYLRAGITQIIGFTTSQSNAANPIVYTACPEQMLLKQLVPQTSILQYFQT